HFAGGRRRRRADARGRLRELWGKVVPCQTSCPRRLPGGCLLRLRFAVCTSDTLRPGAGSADSLVLPDLAWRSSDRHGGAAVDRSALRPGWCNGLQVFGLLGWAFWPQEALLRCGGDLPGLLS
ncbi:unnamed protein product, partial [Polarella glacialis]